jgi:hypothetical protein
MNKKNDKQKRQMDTQMMEAKGDKRKRKPAIKSEKSLIKRFL